MAALLIQPAESRMQRFAACEGRERLRNSLQVALTHRYEVEHVAIFRHLREQSLRIGQSLGKPAVLEQAAKALHLDFDGSGGMTRHRVRNPAGA